MIIRDVHEKDLAGIRDIYSIYFAEEKDSDYFVSRVKEALNRSELARQCGLHYLVAEIEGKIAGLIGYRKPSRRLLPFTTTEKPIELYSLFVAEKSKGVGRQLVGAMLQKVREYTEVVVYSSVKWHDSWAFYDKLGFTRVGKLVVDADGQVWTLKIPNNHQAEHSYMKLSISILALLFGPFLFIYGGYDDSPGAQLLGLLIFLSGLVYLIKGRRGRKQTGTAT